MSMKDKIMGDLGMMKEMASGSLGGPAPAIHAAGVLRCLEGQQGTALMLSSVIAAIGWAAVTTGRGPFFISLLDRALEGLKEDLADMQSEGRVPPPPVLPGTVDVEELIIDAIALSGAQPVTRGGQVVDLAAFRQRGA